MRLWKPLFATNFYNLEKVSECRIRRREYVPISLKITIMPLIKSISGIRGTLGGAIGDSLSPFDLIKYTSAFGTWLRQAADTPASAVVVGRDARLSGEAVSKVVVGTLQMLGLDVIDLGLSTTPTVEMAVVHHQALGGIIITASHNPLNWNALKLLNHQGEFISASDGEMVLDLAEKQAFGFVEAPQIGQYSVDDEALDRHIDQILALDLVDVAAIQAKGFSVIVDAVNSSGGIAVPKLLTALGVKEMTLINGEPTGWFAHNPEPLPENLIELHECLATGQYDLGIAVDPDVDRLVFGCENGQPFGEEFTLVAVADYILQHQPGGNTVSNLSSTVALRELTVRQGGEYSASAVGEVNVVSQMKAIGATIGGEGNGGVIYADLHYGRDALVGIALFLTYLARSGKSMSELRAQYPAYVIAKNKLELSLGTDLVPIFQALVEKYKSQPCNTTDGVKIEFGSAWVHMRPSNTEPIVRIYAEAENAVRAHELADQLISDLTEFSSLTQK